MIASSRRSWTNSSSQHHQGSCKKWMLKCGLDSEMLRMLLQGLLETKGLLASNCGSLAAISDVFILMYISFAHCNIPWVWTEHQMLPRYCCNLCRRLWQKTEARVYKHRLLMPLRVGGKQATKRIWETAATCRLPQSLKSKRRWLSLVLAGADKLAFRL